MKITLIHNPEAGDDRESSAEHILRLIRAAGHKFRYQSSKEKQWKRALKKPCDLVAVAGGDGIVGRVARRLIGSRIPIAVLPMGTANNVAHTLGLTGKTLKELIGGWNAARCVNFDAGVAKGPWGSKYFIEGFGVGLFAETMFQIKNGEHPGPSRSDDPKEEINAVLKVLKRQLSNYPSKDLTVRLDGQDLSGDYFLLEALNVRYIGPNLDLVPHAKINDGLLDVVFVAKDEQGKLKRYISDRLKHKHSRVSLTIHRGRHLQVEWKSSPVHIDDTPWPEDKDGSPVLSNAIDIKTDPGALVLLIPS
jgi:diacylglycerol kinase family enzyme